MSFDLSRLDRSERLWRCPEPEFMPPTGLHSDPHRGGPSFRQAPAVPPWQLTGEHLLPIGPKPLPALNPEIEKRQKAWAEIKQKHKYLGGLTR